MVGGVGCAGTEEQGQSQRWARDEHAAS